MKKCTLIAEAGVNHNGSLELAKKFADEALAIKRGEAEERVISGTASQEEVEQLREEGVDVLQVPVVPKNKVN